MLTRKPETVEEYISSFPPAHRKMLKELRALVKKAAPEAEEMLSYSMPSYKHMGRLVYFAAHTAHIGFYPFASAITAFKKELTPYKGAKGSVQFPLGQPLPASLISSMLAFRVKENEAKAAMKKKPGKGVKKKAAAGKAVKKK